MRNLRLTKGTAAVRRVAAVSVVAAGVAAVTAGASPAQGAAARHHNHPRARVQFERHALRVQGANGNDAIALRLAAGNPAVVQVDLGDNGSADFSVQRARIQTISIEAGFGDDRIRIDDTNGTFTDTIPTRIDGGPGNDTISGGAGTETLIGGPGSDTIDGNGGNDVSDLGPGDDSFVWDPGDGSDSIEGGPGTDTMAFNGAAASETVDLSANGSRLRFFRAPGNITMDTHGVEQVNFNALGGADTVTINNLAGTGVENVALDLAGALGGTGGDGQIDRVVVNGTPVNDVIAVAGDASGVTVSGLPTRVALQHPEPADQLTVQGLGGDDAISATALPAGAMSEFIEGGDGNDTIAGGPDAETLLGGIGNDSIDGNGGNDRAGLGAGNDTFVWDPGDGSDTLEGDDGLDTMAFNGAAASETVNLSANGDRLRFFRNPGNITMDTHGVERVAFNALGGADVVTVGELTGTGVTNVDLDLAGTLGGTTGDGQADRVVVDGTTGDDAVLVSGSAGDVSVGGLAATVQLTHTETADQLDVETLEGNDAVASAGLAAGTIQLFVNGLLVP
jgi:Ca2+-binding RTX toxin-like protein